MMVVTMRRDDDFSTPTDDKITAHTTKSYRETTLHTKNSSLIICDMYMCNPKTGLQIVLRL